MLIDCDTCAVRGAACGGCVVHALLQITPEVERLESAEARAIEILARAGFEVTILEEVHRPSLPILRAHHPMVRQGRRAG